MTDPVLLAAIDQDTATGGHRCADAVRAVLDLNPLWNDTRCAIAEVFGVRRALSGAPTGRHRAGATPHAWILPRADCDTCGRDTAMHRNGRLYNHTCRGGLYAPLSDQLGEVA